MADTDTKTYIALVPLNVHHKLIKPNDTVELTDDEAAGALAVSAITTQCDIDAAKQAVQDASDAAMQAAGDAVQAPAKAVGAKAAVKTAAK